MSTPMNLDQSPVGAASPASVAPMIESLRRAIIGEESPLGSLLYSPPRPWVEDSTAPSAGLSQTIRRIFPELSPRECSLDESMPAPPPATTAPPTGILLPQGAVASAAAQGAVASVAAQPGASSAPAQSGAVAFASAQPGVALMSAQPGASSAPAQPGAVAVAAQPGTSSASAQPGPASTSAQPRASSATAQPEAVVSVGAQPGTVAFAPVQPGPVASVASSVSAQPGVVAFAPAQLGAATIFAQPRASLAPVQPGAVAFAAGQPGAASTSAQPGAISPSAWRKRRGRPVGAKNKQKQKSKAELKPVTVDRARKIVSPSAISRFTPHEFFVEAGEDIAEIIVKFTMHGTRTVTVISATGNLSRVTLEKPGTSGEKTKHEGLFRILSLNGSFMWEDGWIGGLDLMTFSADGSIVGGSVAGELIAADQVQVIVATVTANGKEDSKSSEPVEVSPAPVEANPGEVRGANSQPSHDTPMC